MTGTETEIPVGAATGPLVAVLPERGCVRVSGPDAKRLLDGLVTNDIDRLAEQPVVHAGLLTPQGKILFAMSLAAEDDGLLIDVRRQAAADLVKRLNMYKLRANVVVEDVSDRVAVAVQWNGDVPLPDGVVGGPDPRSSGLGQRLFLPPGRLAGIAATPVGAALWHDRRIALGIAEEAIDYSPGDTFPHEANFDLTGSVDFRKGCFVGQEVVSRMQHKTVVRKRVVKVGVSSGGTGLKPGQELHVTGGPAAVGTVGSVATDGRSALAFLKLDRVADALARGVAITAGDGPDALPITVDATALARYRSAVAAREERTAGL